MNQTVTMTLSEHVKRSDMEIAAAILTVARKGAKKSHIIYQANLNFLIGQKYLDRLIASGLLRGPIGDRRVYQTTAKGVAYLTAFQGFTAYLPQPAPAAP